MIDLTGESRKLPPVNSGAKEYSLNKLEIIVIFV